MKKALEILLGIVGIICFGILLWFGYQYARPKGSLTPTMPTQTFPNTTVSGVVSSTGNNPQVSPYVPPEQLGGGSNRTQKIFKIANGPVAAAVFISTQSSTSVARFIAQDSGHVFDQPIDSPGALARSVSNTTIPGIARAFLTNDGSAGILQYEETGVIKSVYISLATSTTNARTSVRFLPNNIYTLALAPDGKAVAYTTITSTGMDVYTATIDGTNPKKITALPVQQALLTWPSQSTLLLQTKPANETPGMLFSIAVKTGLFTPLLYSTGVSAQANATFSKIIYQTNTRGSAASYVHDTTSGKDASISFTPIPQKCAWSSTSDSVFYCAAPAIPLTYSYVDAWRAGTVSVSDALFTFNNVTGQSLAIASPGSSDGGVRSDIMQISVSSDNKYLLFITKGDRALWGVRLTQ